jgi:endonuclease/exonuclease/phosphatase family metal-dependent hydrolase
LPNEQRGLLEVHVRVGGRQVIFFATHFDYHPDDSERMASIAMLRELIQERQDAPLIVAGDLNALPSSRVMKEMDSFLRDSFEKAGDASPTFPADKPYRRIDYILMGDDRKLRCVEHRVIPEDVASDHRPVLAVLKLRR